VEVKEEVMGVSTPSTTAEVRVLRTVAFPVPPSAME